MTLAELLQSLHSNPNRQMAEIAQRIDTLQVSGGQGVSVADLGATTDLVLDPPAAAAQGAAYDQTAINLALDAKADQLAVDGLTSAVESRLDAIEAKLDALLASLRDSGQIAP